jgi:hypothetical protein
MLNSRLQEYSKKNSLPFPVYDTANEGSVTVKGAKYDSPLRFKYKNETEKVAIQAAIKDLLKQGLSLEFKICPALQ